MRVLCALLISVVAKRDRLFLRGDSSSKNTNEKYVAENSTME